MLLLFFNVCSAQAAFIKSETFKDDQDIAASQAAGYEGVTETSMFAVIQTVISAFLSLVGVILLAYLLYAGYNWMTAQGEEEKVTKAKDTLKRAIVGLIIIVGAYAISIFVMGKLQQGTLTGSTSNLAATAGAGATGGCTAAGCP